MPVTRAHSCHLPVAAVCHLARARTAAAADLMHASLSLLWHALPRFSAPSPQSCSLHVPLPAVRAFPIFTHQTTHHSTAITAYAGAYRTFLRCSSRLARSTGGGPAKAWEFICCFSHETAVSVGAFFQVGHLRGAVMGAAAYVGRVGGLAVALGVGAAVASGQGVASASPTESTSPTSESSTSESSEESGSGTTPDTNSTDNSPTSEDSSEAESPTPTSRGALKSTATRIAELGKALSTGGALTSKKVTKDAEQAGSQQAESDKAADAEATVVADADAVAPEDSEEATPPVPTRTPPKIIDVVTSTKRSSNGPADKPAEGSISRVPAPRSAVEVRTVDVVADKDVTAEKSADSVLQRTASAVEPTTFRSLSSLTATQDGPEAMMSAPDDPAAQAPLPQLVTNVLSVFGLGSLASDVPGVPGGSPFALALLALGARRETEETFSTLARTTTTSSTPVAAATLTGPPTAAVTAAPTGPAAVSSNTDFVEYVTGANSPNATLTRFGIGGTDLGIMWDNGIKDNPATTDVNEHQVLIAFGDTFRDSRQQDGLADEHAVPHLRQHLVRRNERAGRHHP